MEMPLDYHMQCQATDAEKVASPQMNLVVIGGDDFCSVVPFSIIPASWVILSHLSILAKVDAVKGEEFVRKQVDHCAFLLNLADTISFAGLSCCVNSVSRLHICFSLKIVAYFSPWRSQRDAAEAYLMRMGCEQFV